jgi:hypothetical protein
MTDLDTTLDDLDTTLDREKLSIVADGFCDVYEDVTHEYFLDEDYRSILTGFCWADGITDHREIIEIHNLVEDKIGNY